MHDAPPDKAHQQAPISRMTNHGVWAARDKLVVFTDALLKRKKRSERSQGLETDKAAHDDERRAEDERDGQFT